MGECFFCGDSSLAFVVDVSESRGDFIKRFLEKDGLNTFDFSIVPVPALRDNATVIYIFAPSKRLVLADCNLIANNSIVFCTEFSSDVLAKFSEKNCTAIKLFDDELLAIANAKLTAHGTLDILKKNYTLFANSDICTLVLGAGRVGSATARLLNSNNYNIDIATNDLVEHIVVQEFTNNVFNFARLDSFIVKQKYSCIINTVPSVVLDKKRLAKIKRANSNCFIIDLASLPGGVDKLAAETLGLHALHALGVPTKHYPELAANIMLQSILKRVQKYIQQKESSLATAKIKE